MWALVDQIRSVVAIAGFVFGPMIAGPIGTRRAWLCLFTLEVFCFLPDVVIDDRPDIADWFRVIYVAVFLGSLVALWFMSEDWREAFGLWWERSWIRLVIIAWVLRLSKRD